MTVPMTNTITSSVPKSSRARSERKRSLTACWPSSPVAHQRDPPKIEIRVAQTVHLDVAHVLLEQALVAVVQDRDERRVVQDLLLGPTIRRDPPLHVRFGPGQAEQRVDVGALVRKDVTRTPRVEQLRQEIVRVGHV